MILVIYNYKIIFNYNYVHLPIFFTRRTRERAKEDFPEMGELALGACRVPHRRPLRGHERRQDAYPTPRGAFRRETGEFTLSSKVISEKCTMVIL